MPTRPAPLAPGSSLRVVGASSPFDLDRYRLGHALLSQRYALSEGHSLFSRAGYLAGSDDQRGKDLQEALADPDVRAIVPPRGGYGATRLLPSLSLDAVRRADKWLVGFSDVTALHALWARAGLCSIHGPMVCSLPAASPTVQQAWSSLLEGGAPAALSGLRSVRAGRAEGRLFGGNLTVLSALVGTPYFPDLTDSVLALEDVGERPYRLDRMLTTMLQAGVLQGVRAIVLGSFTDCKTGADGVTVEQVLEERLSTLTIPILADASFGHIDENVPLLLGCRAHVDVERVDFTLA